MADDYEVAEVLKKGAEVVIPPKAHHTSSGDDGTPYKERHLIEGMFHKPKHFHRVATRYDKTAAAFLAFVTIAGICLWLKSCRQDLDCYFILHFSKRSHRPFYKAS